MIYTVTLNPAIDKTFVMDEKKNIIKEILQPAGKGINVSLALNQLNQKSTIITLLGGDNGAYLKHQINKLGIPLIFLEISGNSRLNNKYIFHDGKVKEVNEQGPLCDITVLGKLQKILESTVMKGDIVVFSGSVPKGLPDNTYQILIESLKQKGVVTVLDANKVQLKNGLLAHPTIIKPNQDELGHTFDTQINDVKEASVYAKKTHNKGIKEVLVTLGSLGSILVASKSYCAEPMELSVKNTVGAGDSFLAGYIYGKVNGYNLKDAFTFAVAVASSSVVNEVTGIHNNQASHFFNQIVIKEM